jgi:hypothetical protein
MSSDDYICFELNPRAMSVGIGGGFCAIRKNGNYELGHNRFEGKEMVESHFSRIDKELFMALLAQAKRDWKKYEKLIDPTIDNERDPRRIKL